ncbi:MAG: iron-siderophore ABC transporter substrate-binding protein [Cyanobacteria bacterium J06649_4]
MIGLVVACQRTSSVAPESLPASLPASRGDSSESCRIISHSMGETCVPLQPQRVVTLTHLDNALALGVKPIGAATQNDNQFSTFLPAQAEGIENVGLFGEPSLEKLVQLKPDLILLAYPKQNYEQLSAIAPTVVFWDQDPNYEHWQDTFSAYADALGKTQVAEDILGRYGQRVSQLREALGDRRTSTKISLVNFFASDVRLYLKESFGGQILEEIGLPRPASQDKDDWSIEHLSLEAIPQMDGDVMFLTLGAHEQSKLDQFKGHPLWAQLNAVKQKQVYEVNDEIWISGETPVAANLVLDDLFQYLVNK